MTLLCGRDRQKLSQGEEDSVCAGYPGYDLAAVNPERGLLSDTGQEPVGEATSTTAAALVRLRDVKHLGPPLTTIYCTSELRDQWPRPLAELWHEAYPHLFDEDDLRLALSQVGYHFCEWFLAIHLYHRHGTHALLEKYDSAKHRRKRAIIDALLDEDQRSMLLNIWPIHHVQPPDLLVFQPDYSQFWFAEAKGPGDGLSAKQRQSHEAITAQLGVPVVEVFRIKFAQPYAGN